MSDYVLCHPVTPSSVIQYYQRRLEGASYISEQCEGIRNLTATERRGILPLTPDFKANSESTTLEIYR
jgi:hypothetical protein